MLSTLKRQCNCQVQRFCVTQVCLYMLSVINTRAVFLASESMRAIVRYMLLLIRLSVRLSVCHTGGCIDVARLPMS